MLNPRKFMTLALTIFSTLCLLESNSLYAGKKCCGTNAPIIIRGQAAPEVKKLIRRDPLYRQVYQNLVKKDNLAILEQDLINLYSSLSLFDTDPAVPTAAYNKLYADAQSIVNNYCPTLTFPPRLTVTTTSGIVVVDTDQGPSNTLQQFLDVQLGDGFNGRISILDAQAWPAGFGVETEFNFARLAYGSGVAARLGPYLSNQGTVRLSIFPDQTIPL